MPAPRQMGAAPGRPAAVMRGPLISIFSRGEKRKDHPVPALSRSLPEGERSKAVSNREGEVGGGEDPARTPGQPRGLPLHG